MKIHFSNVNFSSSSGPNAFAGRLANELARREYQIVSKNDPYDIFLCFIEPSSTPNTGSKFIHRLDGIWFKPDQFHSHNKKIKWAYDNADHTIWQSDFDRKMTSHHWGNRKGSIINNGIDLNPIAVTHVDLLKMRAHYKNIFVCSASWHRQKRLKENTDLFLLLKQKYINSCLIVMGVNPDHTVDHEDIFYTGNISHNACLEIFSVADWMIHLAWLDHCPNVVVEALAQNCKIICTDSGGTSELVKSNGLIIPETTPYNFELIDFDLPHHIDINSLKLELPNISINNMHVDIGHVTDLYQAIFEEKP